MGPRIRPLDRADLPWAESLFDAARRDRMPAAPRFWNVAPDAVARHLTYLEALLERPSTVALRTDRAAVIAPWTGDRYEVDDFAVDAAPSWPTDGAALLSAVTAYGPARFVAPRVCEPGRHALAERLGFVLQQTWWLKDVMATGPVELGEGEPFGSLATLVEAPPVYAPGGPVVLIRPAGALVEWEWADVETWACSRGAVVAVAVQLGAAPGDAVLEAAGYRPHCDFLTMTP